MIRVGTVLHWVGQYVFDVAYNLSVQFATPSYCPLRRRQYSLTSPAHLSFSVHHPLRLGHTCDLCRMFWKLFADFPAETNSHFRILYNFVLRPTMHDDQSVRSLYTDFSDFSSNSFDPTLSACPLLKFSASLCNYKLDCNTEICNAILSKPLFRSKPWSPSRFSLPHSCLDCCPCSETSQRVALRPSLSQQLWYSS